MSPECGDMRSHPIFGRFASHFGQMMHIHALFVLPSIHIRYLSSAFFGQAIGFIYLSPAIHRHYLPHRPLGRTKLSRRPEGRI